MSRSGFIITLLITALSGLPGSSAGAASIPVDGYAAAIGDRVITGGEVAAMIRPMQEQAQQQYKGDDLRLALRDIYDSGLQRLIDEALILSYFDDLGATMPEAVVRERVDRIMHSRFNGDRSKLLEALQKTGESETEWTDKIRDSIKIQYITSDHVNRKVNVSPREIRQRYQENLGRYISEELVNLQTITFRIPRDSTNRFELLKSMYRIDLELRSGADFEEMAKQHSKDSAASKGGATGWIRANALPPHLQKAVQETAEGEISELVSSGDSFVVAKVLKRRDGGARAIHEVQEELEAQIREEKTDARYTRWIEHLRATYPVQLFTPGQPQKGN